MVNETMSTAEKLAEALEKIAEQHGQWNNGIWAANIALEALAAYRAQPAADGVQRVERMSEADVLKLWDKYASVTNAYEDNGIGFARMLAAAWGVKLDGEA